MESNALILIGLYILLIIFLYTKNRPRDKSYYNSWYDSEEYLEGFDYKYNNDPGFKRAIDKITDKELEET